MKKLICAIMVFFMFSSGVVSADELDFLERVYTSYEETTSLTLELKQPLNALKLLDGNDYFGFFDIQSFFESLADMNMTAEIKTDISADFKKMQMSLTGKSNIPMQINRNFKLTADTYTGVWIDMDFSDDANPKYVYIMQNPMCGKYMTADVLGLMCEEDPENAEKFVVLMKSLLNREVIGEISKITKQSLVKNSEMTKNGKTYTFTFDDKGIKQLYFDIFDKINPVITASMEKSDKKEYEDKYAEIKKAVAEFEAVGKNGVVLKCTLDRSGNISVSEMLAEIDVNIYDFTKALFGFSADVKKEDCNINFAVNVKNEFKNVNKSVKVTAPKITAENSVDINELYRQNKLMQSETDYYGDYWVETETDIYREYENGELAFPLRSIADAFGIPQENISCENGVITIKGTNKTEFDTVQIEENSTVITVDGNVFELNTPVEEINGKALVDTSFVKLLFNFDYSYGVREIQTGRIVACFERSFDYEYEDEDEYDFDSCNDFNVYSDTCITADDGNILMSVEDILYGFYISPEDFEYANGILTVNAQKPFAKLTAEAGSSVITVDGFEYQMKTAAREYEGMLFADASFAEQAFGVELITGEFDIKYHSLDCIFEKNAMSRIPLSEA